jgi:anti-sigma B factor antagonist
MKLEISELKSGIKQAKLIGRLDMKGTNEIDNEFAAKVGTTKGSVIVDMTEVEFLSSIGMRLLISAARAIAKRGGKMVILKPQPLVREVIETAGFDAIIPLYDDFDEACEALKASAS